MIWRAPAVAYKDRGQYRPNSRACGLLPVYAARLTLSETAEFGAERELFVPVNKETKKRQVLSKGDEEVSEGGRGILRLANRGLFII